MDINPSTWFQIFIYVIGLAFGFGIINQKVNYVSLTLEEVKRKQDEQTSKINGSLAQRIAFVEADQKSFNQRLEKLENDNGKSK